MMFISVE